MKKSLITLFVIASISSSFAHAAMCTPATLELAQKVAQQINAEGAVGVVSHLEVLRAQLALTEALECSDTISKKEYCIAAGNLLEEIEKTTLSMHSIGLPVDPIRLVNERIAFDSRCN